MGRQGEPLHRSPLIPSRPPAHLAPPTYPQGRRLRAPQPPRGRPPTPAPPPPPRRTG